MASSRPSSLNPNADPFHYTTPFLFIFKPPPQLRPLIWAPPVHGCGSYVDPYQHHHYQHPMVGFYDVVPLAPSWSWPCSDGFGGGVSLTQPDYSVGNHNGGMTSERKWVPQVRFEASLQLPSALDLMPIENSTTLMIKNIPNQMRRQNLLNILDEHCKWKNLSCNQNNSFHSRRSEYDFVYLPMDFRKYWYGGTISNLGYAFVNFTSPIAASEFCKAYRGREWDVTGNKKVCEIKCAKLQGLKILKKAFRKKTFWCPANSYLPVVLEPPSDGCGRYRVIPVGKRIARPPPRSIKKAKSS